MPKLVINDQEIEVEDGMTVLQAAAQLGVEVPVFCYHPKLSIAGNCRMCLVEVKNSPKPVASCAMPVSEGMVVYTNSAMVEKARKGVLEFLLINHPLDCPICDQGGECDLQDITMAYGGDSSRFDLNKRAVPDQEFGPLIETAMNRCIQCTRCVRFSSEIAGVPELGALGRGEDMEIGTYVQNTITSELSGNMIDICPVGALTSKPYSYRGRSWELSHTPSVDVFDAVGSAIRIDTRGPEVMRILPRQNDAVNETWISDKTRFSCDGLKSQRLDRPYARGEDGRLHPVEWDEAFALIADRFQRIRGDHIAAIAGNMVDAEAMIALKDLMISLGSPHMDCRQEGGRVGEGPRCSYLFNTTIAGIERADFCLLVGTNPRWEAPLINARLRKNYLATGLSVASVGPEYVLGYPVEGLGNDPFILEKIAKGKHPICAALKAATYPMIILGQGAVGREDGGVILKWAWEIAEKYGMVRGVRGAEIAAAPPGPRNDGQGRHCERSEAICKRDIEPSWNGFNVLQTAASRVGALDLGFLPGPKGYGLSKILEGAQRKKIEAVYLLAADEIDMKSLESAFVIYQGHHGDRGAAVADVILPGCAYTEKEGLYVNTEGRVQRGLKAAPPPGEAKEDWRIIKALSDKLGLPLPYSTREEILERLVLANPLFDEVDHVQAAPWKPFGEEGVLNPEPFKPVIENFYMTDAISRHSITMAKCVEQILGRESAYG